MREVMVSQIAEGEQTARPVADRHQRLVRLLALGLARYLQKTSPDPLDFSAHKSMNGQDETLVSEEQG